jgi:ComEC/Rec2-related protein
MNSSTDHQSPITDHRLFLHSTPAVILAVSLLLGCLVGRFTSDRGRPWLSATLPGIAILAMAQPTALALGAVGIVAGITFENLRISRFGKAHVFEGQDLTVKGVVVKSSPSFYGQNLLTIRVSEVLGFERKSVNFHLSARVPAGEKIVQGGDILVRAAMSKSDPGILTHVIRGRTVPGGWLQPLEIPSAVVKGRERLLRALDKFRSRPASGLLGAIALGEKWRVEGKERDIIRKTGTYHLLAISGVHVGAAILPFLLILRFFASVSQRAKPRSVRAALLVLSFCAVGTYICFSGLSASALRAAVYFMLAGAAILVYRSSSPLISLSWCVMAIICFGSGQQPDVSLTLSAMAVTGIVLSCRGLSDRGGVYLIEGLMRMTIGAALFTLPVVVWLAGGISCIAPIGNIAAGIPFGLLLIPSAVLADWAALQAWFPLDPIISLWLKAADPVLWFMAWLADLPISFLILSREGCLAASLAAVMGVLVWRHRKYRLGAGFAVFLFILAVSLSSQVFCERVIREDLVINFPSMGQADAAIIRYKGQTVLVDCGPVGHRGRDSPAAKALQRLGIRKIDAIFLSHLHPDHAGGLKDILARWPVQVIYLPADPGEGAEWRSISGRIPADTNVRFLRYGNAVKLSSMVFRVLGPDEVEGPIGDVNRGSVQLLLEVDDFLALFTGDAGWDQVLRSFGQIQSLDLFKVPHHGSKRGFPPAGMDEAVTRLRARGDVIAVCPSRHPGGGHLPAPEVAEWFDVRGIGFVYTGDKDVKIWYKRGGSRGNGSTVVDNPYWF